MLRTLFLDKLNTSFELPTQHRSYAPSLPKLLQLQPAKHLRDNCLVPQLDGFSFMKENSEIGAVQLQGHISKFYASWSRMSWLTNQSSWLLFFSLLWELAAQLLVFLCDSSPSLKSKLSCQRIMDLIYQFNCRQKSSSVKPDRLNQTFVVKSQKKTTLWSSES